MQRVIAAELIRITQNGAVVWQFMVLARSWETFRYALYVELVHVIIGCDMLASNILFACVCHI